MTEKWRNVTLNVLDNDGFFGDIGVMVLAPVAMD